MPDARRHRGPHPRDAELFSSSHWPSLRTAVAELSWLLSRGYAAPSALKLVGDRHRLLERQRTAVMRCSCSDEALHGRKSRELPPASLSGASVEIDGFNLLTTVEAAMASGILLVGRDGCVRDMASMHGSWRKVSETESAAVWIGRFLASAGVVRCEWLLDAPVSNSGRLVTLLRSVANTHGWDWTVATVPSPDALLRVSGSIVLTADSAILDAGPRWFNAAAWILRDSAFAAPIDLSQPCD